MCTVYGRWASEKHSESKYWMKNTDIDEGLLHSEMLNGKQTYVLQNKS